MGDALAPNGLSIVVTFSAPADHAYWRRQMLALDINLLAKGLVECADNVCCGFIGD
jgi:hypothetical protein